MLSHLVLTLTPICTTICPIWCAIGKVEPCCAVSQQWQALVAGLDPQSVAQYLHNMQLLSSDTALDSQGVGVCGGGGWQLQHDGGAGAAQSLPPYAAQAATRQQLAAMAAGRLDGAQLGGGGAAARAGSPFGLLEPALQPQFVVQPRQLARLKGPGPGVAWMAAPDGIGSSAGRLTPGFESPRSVDSAPITPALNQVRRCFSGGNAASSFPTPTFPTPGARFSPQPSPRGAAHRAPTAPLHPSPLAPSSGSGLETPLPQSAGTGFFCPAVSATAPRSRGGRSNRQRQRETPSSTTAEAGRLTSFPLLLVLLSGTPACSALQLGTQSRCAAVAGCCFCHAIRFSLNLVLRAGKSEAAGARRRRGSRRSLESDLSRSAANTTADAADASEPQLR
jgi:hypothetical protein